MLFAIPIPPAVLGTITVDDYNDRVARLTKILHYAPSCQAYERQHLW